MKHIYCTYSHVFLNWKSLFFNSTHFVTCICVCVCVCVCVCMCMCYAWMCVCACVCAYVHVLCMDACACVCVWVRAWVCYCYQLLYIFSQYTDQCLLHVQCTVTPAVIPYIYILTSVLNGRQKTRRETLLCNHLNLLKDPYPFSLSFNLYTVGSARLVSAPVSLNRNHDWLLCFLYVASQTYVPLSKSPDWLYSELNCVSVPAPPWWWPIIATHNHREGLQIG